MTLLRVTKERISVSMGCIKRLFIMIGNFVKRYKLRFPLALVQYARLRREFNMGWGEFIVLNYIDMSKEQKESFLFMSEDLTLCFEINPYSQLKVLRDKRTVIQRLPQYLGRECLIEDFTDQAGFLEFVKRHPSFYAKQNFSAAGKGTRVFRDLYSEKARREAFETCKKEGLTIIEAFIGQHPVLSGLYPHVVNTIRIHTIKT